MKTFKCEDMACNHCVSRIHAALEEAKIEHKIDLETKTVAVEGCDDDTSRVTELLDDLGFTPVEC